MPDINRKTIDVSMQTESETISGSFCLPKNSSIGKYLNWVGSNAANSETAEKLQSNDTQSKPFLSVVTRTQGKRIEQLQEVLLCLEAQECDDFELLLVGHNVEASNQQLLDELLISQSEHLREKIRYIPVVGGKRARPLNVAFSQARGNYISILDDDDLVFDNWVSAFKNACSDGMGKILFSYSFTQKWETVLLPNDNTALRAIGAPLPTYCSNFNPYANLFINSAPTLSLAFPSYLSQNLGIVFNEELTTTEDWDFLMRAYCVCGLKNTGQATAIYRLWENMDSSRTIHTDSEWLDNYRLIEGQFDSHPLLFDENSRGDLQNQSRLTGGSFSTSYLLDHSKILYDTGAGYKKNQVFTQPALTKDNCIEYSAHNLPEIIGLQFDLFDRGYITLSELDIYIEFSDNSTRHYRMHDIDHNGHQVDSWHIIFLKQQPCFLLNFKTPRSIKTICLNLTVEPGALDCHIDQATLGSFRLFLGRTQRWLKRTISAAFSHDK